MATKGFSYQFTPNELAYFLFKKKICPVCGGKMTRNKTSEMVTGADVNSKSKPFFYPNAEVEKYEFSYICTRCNREFPLSELTK